MLQMQRIEADFAKKNPKMYSILKSFTKMVEEEQARLTIGLEELKEQAKVASMNSIMRIRRTGAKNKAALPDAVRRAMTLEDLSTASSVVLKEETLVKQGKDSRKWRARHFVLKPEGVVYYETVDDFKNHPERPRGRVMFCDLVCPTGQAADEVPRFMYMMLGRPFVFCLHTEKQTFVISAPSKESLKSWVSNINTAFSQFINQQHNKAALMDAVWVIPTPEIWSVANKLTSNNSSIEEVLNELLMVLHDQFEEDVWNLRLLHTKKIAFEHWRTLTRQRRRTDTQAKASSVSED